MFLNSKKNGDDRVRTDDPHNAIVVLFQLSYIPVKDSFITPYRPTCVNLYFYFFSTTFLLFFCPSASILYFSAAKIRLGRFFIYLSFFSTPANRFPRRTSRGDSIRISTMTIVSKQICLFAVAALFALPACAPKKEQPKQKLSDVVEVAYPVKKDIETWDSFTARIEGVKSVQIRSRVSGYLEKILFTDGDYVEQGSLLFKIDPRPFQAVTEACKAAVMQTNARIELARSNLKRAEELFAQNAISKEVYETRKSELQSAQAVLLSDNAKLKEAELDLEFTQIVAPISGFVSRRLVDEGNLINATSTVMANVVSRDTVYAYFEISERDIINYNKKKLFESIDSKKRSGPPVRLKLLDETSPSHFGQLTYVDNTLNASSLELRAEIDNSSGALFPGMFATIELRNGAPSKCLLVPEAAIGTDLVGRFVYIVNSDNVVEYRAVTIGELVGKLQVVTSGLDGSEKVVVNGLRRAAPKKKVSPVLKKL